MGLVIGLVPIFAGKNVLMNIQEYSNELICVFEYPIKGQFLRSYLVPILSICFEHRLRYA